MARIDLANKLRDDGMQRQRVNEAMAALLESGMLITHNELTPPEVSLA